jgi:replication fork clamp-binding protein CrfC
MKLVFLRNGYIKSNKTWEIHMETLLYLGMVILIVWMIRSIGKPMIR